MTTSFLDVAVPESIRFTLPPEQRAYIDKEKALALVRLANLRLLDKELRRNLKVPTTQK